MAGDVRADATERHRIAVVGYGEGAGREQARSLRGAGHTVDVAVLPGGMSWVNAVRDGFRPGRVCESVKTADVVVLTLRDEDLEIVYWEEVAPLIRPGTLLLFTSVSDRAPERLPAGVDVATVAKTDAGILIAVHQDASSRGHERVLSFLQSIGGPLSLPPPSSSRPRDASDPFPHRLRCVL